MMHWTANDPTAITRVIIASLPTTAPGMTPMELVGKWIDNPPHERAIRRLLIAGVGLGLWSRTGLGVAGSPFRYHRPTPVC